MTSTIRSTSRIVGLGDSLVGTLYNTYTPVYTAAQTYYRGGSAIRGSGSTLNGGTVTNPVTPTWLNSGVNGDKAADVDARVQADVINQSPQPNFVILAVGVNDWGVTTDNAFSASYASILTKLINGGIPAANIVCVSIVWDDEGFVGQRSTNPLIQTAATNAGAVYADLWSYSQAWEAINNPNHDLSGHATTDGIHPNATGKALVSGASTGWIWNYITLSPL